MKTYEQINDRIESGRAVVLTADEIMDYVDKKGVSAAAKEVDVVTTLERIAAIEGIDGVMIVKNEHVGLAGRLPPLVKIG